MNRYEELLFLQKEFERLKSNQKALEKFCIDRVPPIKGGSITQGGFNLTTIGDLYGFSVNPVIIPVGTDNQVLTADASQSAGLGWVNGTVTLTKTAIQTIDAETTLQDVTELVLVLKPNTRYYVLVNARMISPAAADIDITFEAIAGTDYAQFRVGLAISDLVNFGTEDLQATSGVNQSLFVCGWLQTGAGGGTLQLQFAQNVSNAGDTSILEGSGMIVTELG